MKMIFKNFIYVLKRFKTSSILNILGLSAAFTVFIVLSIQVYYDLSYNRNFNDADDIYMLTAYSPFQDQHTIRFNTQTGDGISEKTPMVQAHTTIANNNSKFYDQKKTKEEAVSSSFTKTRGDFAKVFSPKVLEGSIATCFQEGNDVAISQKTAKNMFGNESPIGKTIINYNGNTPYTIVAILEDFPENCSLNNGVFGYLREDHQTEWSYTLYLKIDKQDYKNFQHFIKTDDFLGEGAIQKMQEKPEFEVVFSAIPLIDIHLKFPAEGRGDMAITLSLLIIAIITLIIAYINFVNFSMAMAPARTKTMTIQQIFGVGKSTQRLIIATESALFSIIAFFIALLLVNLMKGSPISELFSADISIENNQTGLIILLLGFTLLGFIFGIYPAKYITSFNVVEALKGSSANTVKSSKFRSILITFQFTAAIILIIVTLFIKAQYDYMVNYSWGIEKENIIYLYMKDARDKALTEDLLKDPRIIDHTSGQFVPGYVHMGWGRDWEGKRVQLKSWPVADNYLQFFGISIAIGEDFTKLNNPDKVKMIFNEEFVRKHEFKGEDLIGKEFPAFGTPAQIVGIAKDVNFETLKMPIQPMAFITLEKERNHILFLKLAGSDIKGVIKTIEDIWPKYSKETLELQFLDDELESLYRNENNLGKLVGIFSVITILIAIMGVYGLITFNTKYRMKEIAIRKVNGATEKSIMLLINKGMYIQLLIAFVIASPIAYILVNKWLENFAYRTPIYWWAFPLAAIIILLITVVAVSWQSYRAAIMNPVKSLKSE